MPIRKCKEVPPAQLSPEQVRRGLESILKIAARSQNCTVEVYEFRKKTEDEMRNGCPTFIRINHSQEKESVPRAIAP